MKYGSMKPMQRFLLLGIALLLVAVPMGCSCGNYSPAAPVSALSQPPAPTITPCVNASGTPCTATITMTPTGTLTPLLTPTPTKTGTSTPTSSATGTPTVTSTFTPTSSPTFTGTPTVTWTETRTATATSTSSFTATDSFTPTFTYTNTDTFTATPTPTDTATNSPTSTPTLTATVTPTFTPTNSATNTPTSTPTSTATSTPTVTPTTCGSTTAVGDSTTDNTGSVLHDFVATAKDIYLNQVTVPGSGTIQVHDIWLHAYATSSNSLLTGLYTDNGGAPQSLIASNVATVTTGTYQVPLSLSSGPLYLEAGNKYWIALAPQHTGFIMGYVSIGTTPYYAGDSGGNLTALPAALGSAAGQATTTTMAVQLEYCQ